MPRKAEEQKESAQKAKKLELLKKLYTSPYRDRKDRNPERVDGTCEWFTNHPLFRSWQESKTSSLLWVSADPGCGKSVLAKYLVDTIEPSTKSRTTCYFFFKDDFEDQRDAASALCCILRQIFIQNDALLSDKILEKFEADGEKLVSSFRDLWDILIGVASGHGAGEIICILDALDECEDKGRSQIAQALRTLYWTETNKLTLKFLLTSRPYVHIQQDFQSLENRLPTIHLSGEGEVELEKISREINIFIKSRVNDIGGTMRLLPQEQQVLQDELIRVPNRTYLWVHLTLDVIQNSLSITRGSIRADIKKIPRTVDEAYDKILCRSRDFEKAKRLLHIMVAAARPLSLKEMALALAIQENHRSYDDLELEPEDRFRITVRELCGLFVTVVDSKIYLLHQTAKEFLVQKSIDLPDPPNQSHLQWKFSLWPGDSNRILAEICIWHLLFREFETSHLDANSPDQVFLDYSANNWAAHFREAYIGHDVAITPLAVRICNTRFLAWFRFFWTTTTHMNFPEQFTGLMIASYFGLERVVKLLLEMDGVDLNSTDDIYGRSALSWAAENGHKAVVKLLLRRRAKVGLKAAVKLLLKKGDKAGSKDKDGRTPLSYAAANGNEAIVQLLLDTGKVEADSKNKDSRTPLSYAAANGHETIVQLLLKTGKVEADSKNKDGWTPLSYAAVYGHEAVVQLLLKTGKVEAGSKDKDGWTPLSYAAAHGNEAIVQLLLDTGKVEADSKNKDSRTPLSYAATNGHETVVQLLLKTGKVEADSKDKDGWTPLSYAAVYGHEAVVQLLLKTGKVEADSKDKDGWTLLSYAAAHGNEAIVQLLLKTGKVEADSKNKNDQTPLSYAAANGNEAIVQLLLDTGKVEADSKNKDSRTPLSYAAAHGNEAIVQLLLKTGKVEADSKDKDGQTPLSHAAAHGNEAIVQLLLDTGKVEADSKDKDGWTLLSYAAANRQDAIVKLLRKHVN